MGISDRGKGHGAPLGLPHDFNNIIVMNLDKCYKIIKCFRKRLKEENMATLVIHAPDYRVKDGAKSFEKVLGDGIGEGYAIGQKYISKLPKGSNVVLLRKDRNRKRAEGILVKLVPTTKTPQGIQRYDVHVEKWTKVPYKSEKLNRFGVAVIEGDC